MGKILMFKDADFSEVAVDVVPTGVIELTPTILNGLAIDLDGTITSNSSFAIYYVPMIAGRTYQLKILWSGVHLMRVGKSSNVPVLDSTLTLLVNQEPGHGTTSLDYAYIAESNGYLAWQMHIADTIKCLIKEWQYE